MLIKKAECKLSQIETLNTPDLEDFIVDQQIKVAHNAVSDTQKELNASQKEADLSRDGDHTEFNLEAEITKHPSSLYVKCFAIKADETNDNGDYFSQEQLIEAVPTFIGVPVFTNHQNTDVNQSRGKVVHSWWDEEKNGIMIIARVDAEAYPPLARGIKEEYIAHTSMGCFTGDCRVLLSNGTYIPIRDIQPGDMVITHKGNVKPVLNTQVRYKTEQLVKLKYEGFGSELEVTQNHPILTLNKSDKCACGCGQSLPNHKPGTTRSKNWKTKYRKRYINGHSQNIWNSNKYSQTHSQKNRDAMQLPRSFTLEDFIWTDAKDLNEGDVVVFPVESEQAISPDNITAQHAKLIGFFLAEGSYKKYSGIRKEVNFSFCYSKEKDTYAQEVIELLKRCFGSDLSIWTQHRFPDQDTIIVCCHNEKVAEWFYHYCGEYSSEKRLSHEILSWPSDLQKQILVGFIEGDGCITTRNHNNSGTINPYTSISFHSVSNKLMEQFSLILSRCGIWHTFWSQHNSKAKLLKLCVGSDRIPVDRVIQGKARTMNVLPVYEININQNYSLSLMSMLHKQKTVFNESKTFKDHDDILTAGPFLIRKIKSKDLFVYDGPVYNLQVKDDNSYIAEGATVKNCQVQYSLCSVCHNYAESPESYCTHIKEQKTRQINAKKQKCEYFKNGTADQCPICGSTKDNVKKYAYEGKSFEYNYGIKFIENSFVVNPACHDCGVTEVIDPVKFRAKVAAITEQLPQLLKAAANTDFLCDDKRCYKIAGEKQITNLNEALSLLSSVSSEMLQQREQIDLEFLSDLVKVMADLQSVTDELTQQGYGRLPAPGESPEAVPEPTMGEPTTPVNPIPGGTSNVYTGNAGVGTVTTPADVELSFDKIGQNLFSDRRYIELPTPSLQNKILKLAFQIEKLNETLNIPFNFN